MRYDISQITPRRFLAIFSFVLTVFLIILKKNSVFFLKPLPPKKFKITIEKLGPCFIKFAQVLATRADLFPQDYLLELKEFHDEIEPMESKDFQKVFKFAFGSHNPFSSFSSKPIASASIGQVHVATLNKTKVAVKLRRFGIEKKVKTDISILKFLTRLFNPLFSTYTKNSIESLIDEFSKMILLEVDLSIELKNLKEFSISYANSGVLFPKPFENYCSKDALVMSFEDGFRFDDSRSLSQFNVDFRELMKKIVMFYTDQMLIKGFFHADPHPGNLLITDQGQIILLDFGMVKKIPRHIRIAMIELAKAANEYDFEHFILACKKLGIIAYEAQLSQMQEYAEKMFTIFQNDHLSSSSMQALALEVLESMQDFPFKLPQEIVYVMRASSIIEGLGTTYIKNFNGVKDILPILQLYIPKAIFTEETLLNTLIGDLNNIPFILKRARDLFFHLSDGSMTMHVSKEQVEWVEKEVKSYLKGIVVGFVFMFFGLAFLISSSTIQWFGWFIIFFGILKVIYSL